MSRKDLLVGVGDLLRRPGTRRELRRTLRSEGYVVASARVLEGSEVDLDLVLESTADPATITVTGTISAPWKGECRRCLEAVEGELETEVREVFSRHPVDEDTWLMTGEEIDLGELVRDAVLLALPLAPLCGSDCRGPAPESFPALSPDDSGSARERRDERWSALDQLRFD